ncbi:MAG TPA: caspase family protein [Thermoanaerobaculia bacterium]|nr:caspase family protein [Thermoanaerobaculia bacterium]
MKRKAVIVGISDYADSAPELPAAETEAEEWKNLLMQQYGFQAQNIRMVNSPRATKLAIMERLEWLLTDVEDGDQLFFSFHGHGSRVIRRNLNGMVHDEQDEGLVAYPERGDDVEKQSLYDDDLARLVLLSKLPTYANLTFVLDCCHSGGINLREPDQPRVFIPRDIAHRDRDWRRQKSAFRFGDCRRLPTFGQNPVTLSAVPRLELSELSGTIENRWRSVFSYHTLESLKKNKTQSYRELAESVTQPMLDRNIQNAPVLGGNRARFDHQFLQ